MSEHKGLYFDLRKTITPEYAVHEEKGNDVEWKWYSKWMHKWFKLAEKFKEAK